MLGSTVGAAYVDGLGLVEESAIARLGVITLRITPMAAQRRVARLAPEPDIGVIVSRTEEWLWTRDGLPRRASGTDQDWIDTSDTSR